LNQYPSLSKTFDAVVMLTWSDWHNEPRSNRYHYATRFARHLPVFFVQPDAPGREAVSESIPDSAIEILHVPQTYDITQTRALEAALARRGVRRPLLWIYNPHFKDFVVRAPSPLRVYHATEDYLSSSESATVRATLGDVASEIRGILKSTELVVAVSEGVGTAYREFGGFTGQIVVLPNGCDFEFWHAQKAADFLAPDHAKPIAFYQGSINPRLDFPLMGELADRLPDWEFWYCGKLDPYTPGWESLTKRANVRYHGMLDSNGVAQLARRARVGLIPFNQVGLMRRSLPLKAYEYVACGLPVVTIPIDALEKDPELFHVAHDAESFAAAMVAVVSTRDDPSFIKNRLAAARAQSYDVRFAELLDIIGKRSNSEQATRPRLNVLMLYDDRSTHVHTIKEHLDAFSNYSHHRYHFLPATRAVSGIDNVRARPDFGFYDAIAVHYSVRVSLEEHLSLGVADLVSSFCGPKMLFIQDEYENSEFARRWIERLGINAVFTNVPLDQVEKIYPRSRFPNVDFLPTLTGYVPEDPTLDEFVTPLAERKIVIGYRGRQLPHHYGQLGYEKYLIGAEMKRRAEEAGIAADIEFDDSHRIYGIDWYQFLASCQATLGSESGANVFDDDGSLRALALRHSKMHYLDFAASHLQGRDDFVHMNQISPKIFEAIRLRTALILFEGNYSGIVKPDEHYIPLKKDFSNVAEVFAKVSDLSYLEALTTRAYDEIIATGRYSYATFVGGIDRYIERQCPRGSRARIFSAPVFARYREGGSRVPINPASPLLLDGVRIESVDPRSQINAIRRSPAKLLPAAAKGLVSVLRRVWRRLPVRPRRLVWQCLPIGIRQRLKSLF
jgi:Glycosyl transferases group 1